MITVTPSDVLHAGPCDGCNLGTVVMTGEPIPPVWKINLIRPTSQIGTGYQIQLCAACRAELLVKLTP